MLPAMMARSPRRAAYALLLGALLAGCGKSGAALSAAEAELNPVSPISTHGAAGQITRNTTRLGGADSITDAAAIASAVHPGLTPAGRPQAVVFVRSDDFAMALAASVLAAAPLGAPLLYSEPNSVPSVSVQALQAMRPSGAAALGGAQVLSIGGAGVPTGYVARSLPNVEPFGSAVEVARVVERLQGAPPRHVIVVNAEGPPAFAMPAAGLAAESGAPDPARHGLRRPLRHERRARRLRPPPDLRHRTSERGERRRRLAARAAGEREAHRRRHRRRKTRSRSRASGKAASAGTSTKPATGWCSRRARARSTAPAAAPLSASGDFAPLLLLENANEVPPPLQRYLEDIQAAYSPQLSPGSRDLQPWLDNWQRTGDQRGRAGAAGCDARGGAAQQRHRPLAGALSDRGHTTQRRRGRRRASETTMSQAEDPGRLHKAEAGVVSVEDVRELMGASTPHFALQLRERIRALIADLPAEHPARREGEREIARLDQLALLGEVRGEAQEVGERPLPSLGPTPGAASEPAS